MKAAEAALQKLQEIVTTNPLTKGGYGTGSDNARYGAVCSKTDSQGAVITGPDVTHYNGHPCHAYMKGYKSPLAVYNQYGHRPEVPDEVREAFLNWIISDNAPWREFKGRAVTETPSGVSMEDFIRTHGWVWTDLKNHPSNLQHNFLVVARMPAEWPRLICHWYSLVQSGLSPEMSFLFLDLFKPLLKSGTTEYSGVKNAYWDGAIDDDRWQVNHTNRYDWPVDICTSGEEYVRNFLSGSVEKLNKSYAESQDYKPVNRIFGDNSLAASDTKAYPNVLFERYSGKFGPGVVECEKFWTARGTGMSVFSYSSHWFVTLDEVKEIIRQEEVRFGVRNP